MHHHRPIQRGISIVFVIIFTLSLAIASVTAYFIFSQNLTQKSKLINSFEECARHYPVMESYPEQCNTLDGKHFTKQTTPHEDSAVSDWEVFTNHEIGISISHPKDYQTYLTNSEAGSNRGLFVGQAVSVTVIEKTSAVSSLEEYMKPIKESEKSMGVDETKKVKPVSLNRKNGYEALMTIIGKEKAVIWLENKKYIFEIFITNPNWRNDQVTSRIINSIEFF